MNKLLFSLALAASPMIIESLFLLVMAIIRQSARIWVLVLLMKATYSGCCGPSFSLLEMVHIPNIMFRPFLASKTLTILFELFIWFTQYHLFYISTMNKKEKKWAFETGKMTSNREKFTVINMGLPQRWGRNGILVIKEITDATTRNRKTPSIWGSSQKLGKAPFGPAEKGKHYNRLRRAVKKYLCTWLYKDS